jgi:hypothetical protein
MMNLLFIPGGRSRSGSGLFLIGSLSRSLSENREPTAGKPFWPIFPLIFPKYEQPL